MLYLYGDFSLCSFGYQTGNMAMRCTCPHCAEVFVQDRNVDGLNYCTNCQNLFLIPPAKPVPTWILGVLTFLMADWLVLYWH